MNSRVERYRERQKAMGRKQALFYVTEEEHAHLKAELDRLRSGVASNTKNTTIPPKKTKAVVRLPGSLGVGVQIGHYAIAELKRIPGDDGLRQAAFDTVIDWIETNR